LDIFVLFDEFLVLASALSGGTSADEIGHLLENFGGPKCAKRLPTLKFAGQNVDIKTREYHEFQNLFFLPYALVQGPLTFLC